MDLREMHYLLEIANTGHMTQAANNLFISQPALSKSLRKVENELGTELFYRDGNRLLPTDTGRIVIEKSSEILQLAANMNDAVDSTKNLKRGKVTLGCPSIVASLYLSELLIEFQRIYPEISFHLIEAGGGELTRLTASGEIDLAIVMRPIYSDSLNEIPIVKNQIVACAGQSHPWFNKSYVTISDFKNMPFITFDDTFNLHTQITERFHSEHITPQIILTATSAHFLCQYAYLSNQLLILAQPMINLYSHNNTIHTIPFRPVFPWELSIIFRKNIYLSTASKALLKFIQDYFFRL